MKAFRQGLSADEVTALESVYKVAKSCNYEAEHSSRVTNFALRIFDDLIELHHQLNRTEISILKKRCTSR